MRSFQAETLPPLLTGSRDADYETLEQLVQLYQRRGPYPPLEECTPRQARSDQRMMLLIQQQIGQPLPHVHEVWSEQVDSREGPIPVRVYLPQGKGPFPILFYFHGGGWVLGDLDTAHAAAVQLAVKSGWVVVSVDYRLAPEHPFPAGLQDCYAVVEWFSQVEHAAPIRGDVNRLVVAGDSAGGNLAAAVCLMARDRIGPRITAQLLVYPALDLLDFNTPGYERFGQGYALTTKTMEWARAHYLKDVAFSTDYLVSPSRAEDLSGLPPALVVTAEFDPLRYEAEQFVEQLQREGGAVKYYLASGMEHGFFGMQHLLGRAARHGDEIVRLLAELAG
ncbi:MAG: alpha/beta hydrolase [Anaerolineaceae bacterium]|nr:alpha/beta hydrolase [Anaerolineaceae bacterium]